MQRILIFGIKFILAIFKMTAVTLVTELDKNTFSSPQQ